MITELTRSNIISELLKEAVERLCGKFELIDFLKLTWDLERMPAMDTRGESAEYDIWQHMINNNDMDMYDLLYDYFNLRVCSQDVFLKFIESFVHPMTRSETEIIYFKKIIENHLNRDNYFLIKEGEISKYTIYKAKYLNENEIIRERKVSLHNLSLQKLVPLVIGEQDLGLTNYKNRNKLELFFSWYIENNEDLSQLARPEYALHKMMSINNDSEKMKFFLLDLVDERNCFNLHNNDAILNYINDIIKYDNLRLEKVMDNYRLFGDGLDDSFIHADIHFDEIKKYIIKSIRGAKYIIWIAVAWFTDRDIYNELINKYNEGLDIELILNNDDTNINSGLDYSKFICHKVEPWGKYGYNKEHQKICVIDLEIVIHGSYNWTVNARYNNEEIAIMKGRDVTKKYADRFISIKRELINI